MAATNRTYPLLLELLISLFFALITVQTVYAGSVEDDHENTIIIYTDGIAKVVDSDGKISLSPVDRNIKKGEIKFGVIVAVDFTSPVNNVDGGRSHHRGGKVCVNDNLDEDSKTLCLFAEFQHNYCLTASK